MTLKFKSVCWDCTREFWMLPFLWLTDQGFYCRQCFNTRVDEIVGRIDVKTAHEIRMKRRKSVRSKHQ